MDVAYCSRFTAPPGRIPFSEGVHNNIDGIPKKVCQNTGGKPEKDKFPVRTEVLEPFPSLPFRSNLAHRSWQRLPTGPRELRFGGLGGWFGGDDAVYDESGEVHSD